MKRPTVLLVASTLALGAANLVHTTGTIITPSDSKPMMMYHRGGPGQHNMMSKDLNLIDAQKQQIRDIMKSQRENMKRPSLDERRMMHNLIASDTFDKAKAEAQIDKMEAQHRAVALSRLETQSKIYGILTLKQKKQFNANFEKHLTERNAPASKTPAPAE